VRIHRHNQNLLCILGSLLSFCSPSMTRQHSRNSFGPVGFFEITYSKISIAKFHLQKYKYEKHCSPQSIKEKPYNLLLLDELRNQFILVLIYKLKSFSFKITKNIQFQKFMNNILTRYCCCILVAVKSYCTKHHWKRSRKS